jgi:pectate lyase
MTPILVQSALILALAVPQADARTLSSSALVPVLAGSICCISSAPGDADRDLTLVKDAREANNATQGHADANIILVSQVARAPAPRAPAAAARGIKLTKTTSPIKTSYAGQVIEGLDVWAESGNAIEINHDNVIVRNVRVHHRTGDGINVTDAKGVKIDHVEVINMDPPRGFNGESDTSIINIEGFNASNLTITNTTVRDGASGIYIQQSPNVVIDHVDGYNFHGGFPRGQFVQIGNNSDGSKLSGFYTKSDLYNSRTEDNINVYHSNNVTIENGVVDGNNSPSGVGVLFEGDSGGGIVRNVDVVRQSNGGFSSYSDNVDFFDVRVFDGYNTDIGRGKAMSNGLSFAAMASGVGYDDATYTRPANSGNIFWGSHAAEFLDITAAPNATVMDFRSYINEWDWLL